MTTPIEQMKFKPGRATDGTLTTASSLLGDWTSRAVDVRDYGADPTGIVDATDAIQAAFNDAFGGCQFLGSISGTVLTAAPLSGKSTIIGNLQVGQVITYPDIPFYNTLRVSITIASFGTGTGKSGTYNLTIAGAGSVPAIGPIPMLANAPQQNYKTRPVCLGTGSYIVSSPLYVVGVIGAHIYGDGNGACQIFYTADGTQKNIFAHDGFPANNYWTPVIALDSMAYSKIEGFSIGCPLANAEQGAGPAGTAVPIAVSFQGTISGSTLTVTGGPNSGPIVAGMVVSYTIFPSTVSPPGLTILPFGTGGTTGTGGGAGSTYALSAPPGTVSPATDMAGISVVPRMTGIMLYQSSFTGAGSAIIFENLNIYNMYAGMAGVQGGGNVENCLLINVGFSTCGLYGLWMTGQNVVNWQVYGGGASACGWLSTFAPGANTGIMGGAYYGGVGAIGCLYGLSCTGNQWDCMNDGGQQMHVAGGSFEGGPNLTVDLSWSAGTVTATTNPAYPHKLKFDQPISIFKVSGPASYGGHFTAHITGPTTFTYPLVSNPGATAFAVEAPTNAGCILCNGSAISVDGIAYRVYDTAMARSVYCAGGTVSVNGSLIAAAGDSGTGIIAEMVNGIITIDGTIIETYQDGTFKSAGASELYLKGIIWVPYPTNPFSGFAGGVVREFYKYNASTVADLPAASAIFKGLRSSVTDGAASLAWGATVTGGGSAFYDVVCNGSAWTVTGK